MCKERCHLILYHIVAIGRKVGGRTAYQLIEPPLSTTSTTIMKMNSPHGHDHCLLGIMNVISY